MLTRTPIPSNTPLYIHRRVIGMFTRPEVHGPFTYNNARRMGLLVTDSGTVSVTLTRAEDGEPVESHHGNLYVLDTIEA